MFADLHGRLLLLKNKEAGYTKSCPPCPQLQTFSSCIHINMDLRERKIHVQPLIQQHPWDNKINISPRPNIKQRVSITTERSNICYEAWCILMKVTTFWQIPVKHRYICPYMDYGWPFHELFMKAWWKGEWVVGGVHMIRRSWNVSTLKEICGK